MSAEKDHGCKWMIAGILLGLVTLLFYSDSNGEHEPVLLTNWGEIESYEVVQELNERETARAHEARLQRDQQRGLE